MGDNVKRIPGTNFIVDSFLEGDGDSIYFLTHFHADHYRGLTRKVRGRIYCSETTKRLAVWKMNIPEEKIEVLEIGPAVEVSRVKVTAIDANHCPGSLCLIFETDERRILHTGDFRCDGRFYLRNPLLEGTYFDHIYLDTTYLYKNVPSMQAAVESIISIIDQEKRKDRGRLAPLKILFVFSGYLVGKEKAYLSVMKRYGFALALDDRRLGAFGCFSEGALQILGEEISAILGDQVCIEREELCTRKGRILVLEERSMNFHGIKKSIEAMSLKYDKVLAFSCTGHHLALSKSTGLRGKIDLYRVPYSEHSSRAELLEFKTRMRYGAVINTTPS